MARFFVSFLTWPLLILLQLVNTGKERAKVSLLFTWAVVHFLCPNLYSFSQINGNTSACMFINQSLSPQNSIGGVSHLSGDHVNEPFMWVSLVYVLSMWTMHFGKYINFFPFYLIEVKTEFLAYFFITSKSSNPYFADFSW